MAAVHDRVASAGRFLVSLFPVKENLVDLFRVVRRGSP